MGSNGKVNTKKSQIFKAAVTGDTVGDPLKDTSGPALNILMKLMAIISVVFAPVFMGVQDGAGLISYLMPSPIAAFSASTTLMALPGSASTAATSDSIFTAAIFFVGAMVGMGGMFISTRIRAPPRSMFMSDSLAKPLLVAKADNIEGTIAAGMRSVYVPIA